jgi:hypothetical protein
MIFKLASILTIRLGLSGDFGITGWEVAGAE